MIARTSQLASVQNCKSVSGPQRNASSNKKPVAIAVPISLRNTLTPEEQTSLRHLTHYLGHYDKYVICPRSIDMRLDGLEPKVFDDRFFGSPAAATRLMLSRRFYEAFIDYEYVLVYHLDALVFSDQLKEWCASGYDYVGAPWLKRLTDPEQGFAEVGNGGFSLRRISAMLKVMDSSQLAISPGDYWNKYFVGRSPWIRLINQPRRWLKHLWWFNNVHREISTVNYNEDRFWARRATHYHGDFRIAPVDEALRFAFESAPRFCFEQNRRRLPFGCHAWERYDKEFWEPFLLK